MRYIAVVHTIYYTDPACPWSWALEPALRKLLTELPGELEISYVMCGMQAELADSTALAVEAIGAGQQSGMPVDPRLWLQDPLHSSYPACIAVKAAAEQGDPAPYLRRLREGLFCRGRKLEGADALLEEGRGVPGLDVQRFAIDLGSHASLEAFGADLERARAVAPEHRAKGSDRVAIPSLEFRGPDGALQAVYGYAEYSVIRDAAVAAGAIATGATPPTALQALGRFGTMASAEVAAVCGLGGPPASAELWRLASEWQVKAERVGAGAELWSVA